MPDSDAGVLCASFTSFLSLLVLLVACTWAVGTLPHTPHVTGFLLEDGGNGTSGSCLLSQRGPQETQVKLLMGTPFREHRLLVSFDTAVSNASAEPLIRLWSTHAVESKTATCAENETCSDVAVLTAQPGPGLPSRRVPVRILYRLLASASKEAELAYQAGFDGVLSLPDSGSVWVGTEHLCIWKRRTTQRDDAAWIGGMHTQHGEAGRELINLDLIDEWQEIFPSLGCAACNHTLVFPLLSMFGDIWRGVSTSQFERLSSDAPEVAQEIIRMSETSAACDAEQSASALLATRVFQHSCVQYDAYGRCDRDACSLTYDRVADRNLHFSMEGEGLSHISVGRTAILRHTMSEAGSTVVREGWWKLVGRALLVTVVTTAVYVQADHAVWGGKNIFTGTVKLLLDMKLLSTIGRGEYASPPPQSPLRAYLSIAGIPFFVILATLSILQDASLTCAAVGVPCVTVALSVCLLPERSSRFSVMQWQDALLGLVCTLTRFAVTSLQYSSLCKSGYQRAADLAAVSAILSTCHWQARHFLISLEQVEDTNALGGSSAVLDGLAAMLLAYASPPLAPLLDDFQTVARLLVTLFAALAVPARCFWSILACATQLLFYNRLLKRRFDYPTQFWWLSCTTIFGIGAWVVQSITLVITTTDLVILPLASVWLRYVPGGHALAVGMLTLGILSVGNLRLLVQADATLKAPAEETKEGNEHISRLRMSIKPPPLEESLKKRVEEYGGAVAPLDVRRLRVRFTPKVL